MAGRFMFATWFPEVRGTASLTGPYFKVCIGVNGRLDIFAPIAVWSRLAERIA